jgi:hypothetical protein
MHRIASHTRILTLAIPAALAAALMALVLLGGGTGGTRTLATGPTPAPVPNLTGVSCADVYVDLDNNGIADDINGGGITDADITSLTMSRIEPSVSHPGQYDVTTVSYLGDAGPGGLVPKGPPGPSCASTTTAAATAPEANVFGGAFRVAYANQYGRRPTALGTYTDIPAGAGHLTFSTCAYSEAQTTWVRIDSDTHITKTGKGSQNSGVGTLYLGTSAPTSGGIDTNGDGVIDATTDPLTCDENGPNHTPDSFVTGDDAFPYHFVFTSYGRSARTDHTAASDVACAGDNACLRNRALGIAQDVDGPNTPKTKNVDQSPDGTTEAAFVADDWDGDGCPDWDELGRGYMAQLPAPPPLHYPPAYTWSTDPVNGMDPFNPNDCDQNFGSNISLSTTIIHNTGGAASGNATGCIVAQILADTCTISNGQYFHCLADVTDPKGAGDRPLTFRLGCYSDSTLTVINSSYARAGGASTCGPAPADMCGDGKSDVPPPGCRSAPTPVAPCANSLPNKSNPDPVLGHCPATNAGAPFYTITINCHPERWVYTGITPAEFPVLAVGDATHNYYDAAANQIHIGGCFAGLGGVAFGPNVYGVGLIDAHTGVGSFKLWIQRADCSVPLETDAHVTGTVSIVELQSKKYVTGPSLGTPLPCIPFGACPLYDSDKDGCPDSVELQGPVQLANAQVTGGLRDPYNKWDFFDPFKEASPAGGARKHNALDILIVQQHFGDNEWIKDPANQANPPVLNDGVVNPAIPAYNPAYDRTGIVGSATWNLGPGNGVISSVDMLIAQKSYGHNCPNM